MTRLLADTSAYSALLRGHPIIADLLRTADEIFVTPVVLGELRAGFRRGDRQAQNEKRLESFLASPRVRIADVDAATSMYYATIFDSLRASGTSIGTNDVWIAASAMQHGLRLVTTDGDFRRIVQLIVDWVPLHPP